MPFLARNKTRRGTFRAREQCGAGVFRVRRVLRVGRSEGTAVRHLVGGLLGLAWTVAMPVLAAAMAAGSVLR
eukprot:5543812-Pleurochrysis_carterae.AAC.2